MKKQITIFAAVLLLLCGIGTMNVAAVQTGGTEGAASTAQAAETAIIFAANGGTGSMSSFVMTSAGGTALPANGFTRSGFVFNGWNTQADGLGDAYADKADVSALLSSQSTSVTLYAQWKVKAPVLKSVKLSTPVTLKVSYKKSAKASGYEIQYGVKSNFKKAKTVTAAKKASYKEITDFVPGKKYYVRVRACVTENGTTTYSDWSKKKTIKTKKVSTITNTKSKATIEADVKLSGSGTGYHAKLVICTATSAVSYGLQFDTCAQAPYAGRMMAMIENVASNGAGGQQYTRPGNHSVAAGKYSHLMMTIDNKGNGDVYLDYKKIGSFSNAALANQYLYLRVEGSGRLNGDGVNAVFKNIRLKNNGTYYPDKIWTTAAFDTNPTIHSKVKKDGSVVINGHVSGLPAGGDWDNQFGSVSGIRQFIE